MKDIITFNIAKGIYGQGMVILIMFVSMYVSTDFVVKDLGLIPDEAVGCEVIHELDKYLKYVQKLEADNTRNPIFTMHRHFDADDIRHLTVKTVSSKDNLRYPYFYLIIIGLHFLQFILVLSSIGIYYSNIGSKIFKENIFDLTKLVSVVFLLYISIYTGKWFF